MVSSPSVVARRFSLALLFAISVVVPAARAQTSASLNGVYNGKYTCGQGPTNLKLSVALSPIGDVSALFTFYLPAEAPKLGYTYSLHGQYDPQTANFSLTPVRWETEHPSNLGMVGMDGALSGDRLSGRITGGRCTTFDLTRDKAESGNLAAVITAQKNGGKPVTPSSWTAQLAAAQANTQPKTQPSPGPPATSTPATQAKPPATIAPPAGAKPAAPSSQPQPSQAAAKAPRKDLHFCYTTKPGAPVVYFSDIFDLPYSDSEAENIIEVTLAEVDFAIYLQEKVGYDPVLSKEDTGVFCKFLEIATGKPEAMAAAATKKKSMERATVAAKQKVVETGWKYVADPDTSAAPSAPPAPPNRAQGTQVASAQRPAQPAATQAGAKTPSPATPQAGASPAAKDSEEDPFEDVRNLVTDPVLKWKMDMDSASGESSPHPTTGTFLFLEEYAFGTISAATYCNQNGMSVTFRLITATKFDPPSFVWYENNYEDYVTDVRVEVDGRSHMATGFPREDEQNRYVNTMGIFFYRPDLAQQAAAAQRLQVRTGTGLDSLIGPLVQGAAEAEVNDAQATSGGPVTDLLNAKSIRVDLSIQNWNSDKKPYLELSPQDPVLHKFVAECATRWGIGTPPAKPAPPPANPRPTTRPER
jgi:hypothetical protein